LKMLEESKKSSPSIGDILITPSDEPCHWQKKVVGLKLWRGNIHQYFPSSWHF
jgi:hypothetical protein